MLRKYIGQVKALDYLVKPFSFKRLLKAVNRALERIAASRPPGDEPRKVLLKADKKLYAVELSRIYESGTHVPFIVRIPEKYKHLYPAENKGSRVDRLVSFVDLAPTLLSLIGTETPEFMQGKAFLGEYRTEEPEVLYMFRDRMDERYDLSRSIADGKFRYTRNYNPSRIWLQHLLYLRRAPSMKSWEEAFESGKCDNIQSH